MKKNILLPTIAVFSLMTAGTVFAQTAAEEPTPAVEQAQSSEGQDTVFDMIGSGWNTVIDDIVSGWNGMTDGIVGGWTGMTDAIVDGWNSMVNAIVDTTTNGWQTVLDSITGGKDVVTRTIAEWQNEIESYMTEKNWTEDVQNAWDTLKEGAEKAGSVPVEQAEAAYETVRDWFIQTGETIDQGYAAVIDIMASESGVVEATVSNWYRTVDAFVYDSANQASESVLEAWRVVKQGTIDAAAVAKDQLKSAEETIRDWFQSQGVAEDSDVANAFDGIVSLEQ